MKKLILALFLCFPFLNALGSEQLSFEGCKVYGAVGAVAKDKSLSKDQIFKELKEAGLQDEDKPLFEQAYNEGLSSKLNEDELFDKLFKECVSAHGRIKALLHPKI